MSAAPPAVEVRCGRSDRHEAYVDAQRSAVPDADHVPQQAPVLIDAVGRRLGGEPHLRPRREQPLGDRRGLPSVALGSEVHLGRVDLHEPHALTVAELDCVPVDDPVDSVGGDGLGTGEGRKQRGDDEQDERDSKHGPEA